jgi:hypothetical protein
MRDPNANESSRELAKQIILEIVRASGGTFDGATRLYKAFLFAHLYYFRAEQKILSNWPIVHMPNGHGIDDGEDLLLELTQEGKLEITIGQNGPYPESRYKLVGEHHSKLNPAATRAIKDTARFVADKSGRELSDLVHEKSRCYKDGSSGHELNIYLDLIDDAALEAEKNRLQAISSTVDRVFSD